MSSRPLVIIVLITILFHHIRGKQPNPNWSHYTSHPIAGCRHFYIPLQQSVFTFLFAVCTRTEGWTISKQTGVVFAFLGSCWTSLVDYHIDTSSSSFYGDLTGLVAAMGYGIYTVLLSSLCPKDESTMSMNLLLGYMGLFQMIFWSPGLMVSWLSHGHSTDRFLEQQQPDEINQTVTWPIFSCLILKGLIDNVLSDYLWARAVLMTSATVATVGLGLTIPLAFVSDALLSPLMNSKEDSHENSTSTMDGIQSSWDGRTNMHHILGAILVLVGFVLVNLGHEAHDTVMEQETNVLEEHDNDDEEENGVK